ncbi:hypothetical protein [Mariniblastus fucicola]|uniref:hypothetical protein n=1 Tax=Mariniblastus fucicola TaxID=980251 RepID=UPI00138FE49C|nr:hypothetical protein [Mariniblastus fucicola]
MQIVPKLINNHNAMFGAAVPQRFQVEIGFLREHFACNGGGGLPFVVVYMVGSDYESGGKSEICIL